MISNTEKNTVTEYQRLVALLRSYRVLGIKPIILVDLDGVVFDWSGYVRGELHKELPEHMHRDGDQVHSFYLENVYPEELAKDTILRITKTKGLYSSLKPIEGSIEAIKKLAELDYQVFFCSAPETNYESQMCWSEKAQSIQKHFGRDWVSKLILTKDKTLVNGTILVDDKPPTLIKGVMPPIWTQLLFDQPYNQTGANEGTWRGRWKELYDLLGETL